MGRHFFVVFLSCYAEFSLAAANDWNCEKNEAGEWSCVTQTPSAPVKTTQPVPSESQPVKKPTPQKPQPTLPALPEQKATSAPVLSEPVQKPTPVAPSVTQPAPDLSNKPTEEIVPVSASPTAPAPSPLPSLPKTEASKKAVHKPTDAEVKIQTVEKNSAAVSLPTSSVAATAELPEGWTCAPNAENSTWDCRLVGTNPKGEAKMIADDEASWRLLDPAFALQQEKAFKNLQKRFPVDPWLQCSAPQQPKPKLVSQKPLRSAAPLEIDADYAEVFDKRISHFSGNVEMKRADQQLSADTANYDSASDVMDMQGNVYYSEEGFGLFSNTASLKLAEDKAVLRGVLFESLNGPYRGSAQVAYKDSKELSHYKEAAYTSCPPGNQDWVLHTSRLKLNKDSGLGSATNTWLEFKGVPLIYTPYINFPIDDRRTTGFLPPSWSSTARSGFQLSTPFYWNIAPNYDVLFKPRYLSRRGPLLAAEGRYLTEMTSGSAGIELMPHDDLRKTTRFFGSFKNSTVFLPNLTANADLNYVSDRDYLYELGSALNFADRRYVTSRANLNYNLPGLAFLAQFERYQVIDSTIPANQYPYQKIPQLNLNLSHSFDAVPVDLNMNNEFVYFYRNGRVSGQRFNTKPSVTYSFNTPGAFVTPRVSVQHTQYVLENQTPGLATNIGRTTPIASLDSGLSFEQEFQTANNSFVHTIEPRAYYLYIPRTSQNDIPVFDTALYDFNFASLFRENRFSGTDRVQDANQLSLALTSRLLDAKTGLEYGKFSVGEIFYFQERQVILPGYQRDKNRLSNVVSDLSGNINDALSYSVGTQWNPYSNTFSRTHASLQYAEKGNKIVNLGYLYRKEQVGQTVPIGQLDPTTGLAANSGDFIAIEQTDVSFRWPVYDDWYLMGRWLYALNFNATKESFIGIEKDTCCWRFSIIGRRFSNALSNTVESHLQTGVFVQLELKGLGSFGDQVDQFLQRNIAGYEKPRKND